MARRVSSNVRSWNLNWPAIVTATMLLLLRPRPWPGLGPLSAPPLPPAPLFGLPAGEAPPPGPPSGQHSRTISQEEPWSSWVASCDSWSRLRSTKPSTV